MQLQHEDCIDCMKAIFPNYDAQTLFDHSSGHDEKKPDGLNINVINKFCCGTLNSMRFVETNDDACLGLHDHNKKT